MVPETGIRLHQGLIMGHRMGETPLLFWGIPRGLQTVPNQATSVWRGSICVSSQTGDSTPGDRRAINGVSVLL